MVIMIEIMQLKRAYKICTVQISALTKSSRSIYKSVTVGISYSVDGGRGVSYSSLVVSCTGSTVDLLIITLNNNNNCILYN